jgi:hypothetical protein
MISELPIQKRLASFLSARKYFFINTYFFQNESDVLTFTHSGMSYEYEIKLTRSDFFCDVKKPRHKKMLRALTKQGKTPFVANRFYYVVPTGLVKIEEVPEYAGLIYTEPLMHEVKKAPLLHNDKHNFNTLFDKMYYVYYNQLFK